MDGFNGLDLLLTDERILVAEFLDHRSIRRLGDIRQLGLSSYHQQTRLQHTLESLEIAIRFLANETRASRIARKHLLAAVALEDIGRAPFSNSLDPVFAAMPGLSVGPIDVQRTLLVIQYLEDSEGILKRHGISMSAITELIQGRVPWKSAQWMHSLLAGPIDIDRMQYVSGDIAHAEGTAYDASSVARGLILDPGSAQSIVDGSAVTAIVDFLLQRARLYAEVYFDPTTLAAEVVVRFFLRALWDWLGDDNQDWSEMVEPKSVEEFLRWTDSTVLNVLEGNRWDHAPRMLQELRGLIRDGGLQVAELRQRGATIVQIDEIDTLFAEPKKALLKRQHCWILDREKLPVMQAYQPGTISVVLNKRHRDLANMPELLANPELTYRMRRCPLVVFPTTGFADVQTLIHDAGLAFASVMPLDPLKRRIMAI